MSFDVLQDTIRAMTNPTVAGLDPKPEYVPPHIRKASYDKYGETLEGAADAILQFNKGLMDALCDVVPAVKPQAAYYEKLGWQGMKAMEELMRSLRTAPPAEISGKRVESVVDYLGGDTGLIPSDVLEFRLEEAGKVIVRPSGTEPKLKLYLSVRGTSEADALERLEALDKGARALLG